MRQPDLNGAPLLVLAHKQDCSGALPPSAIAEKLELSSLELPRTWIVLPSSCYHNEQQEMQKVGKVTSLRKQAFSLNSQRVMMFPSQAAPLRRGISTRSSSVCWLGRATGVVEVHVSEG